MTPRALRLAAAGALGFASLLFALLVRAEADVPLYGGDAKVRYGRASRVAEPVYPEAELKAQQGGVVSVVGSVSPAGVMDSPRLTAVAGTSEAFVSALREALPAWLFHTPTDDMCMPSDKPVRVDVEFAVRDGKPHIYLTYAAQEPTPAAWRGYLPRDQVPQIRYPGAALHDGTEAVVFVRTEIDAEGHVKDLVTQSYPKPGTGKYASLEPFEREVRHAMERWKYPADPAKPRRKVCDTVVFNLRP